MATTRQAITRAWTAVLADEQSVNLCNPSPWMIEYCVDTDEPTASEVGVRLPGNHTHPVAVAAGEDLYARIVDGAGIEAAVVVAIDA
jgi:hypothetical protein